MDTYEYRLLAASDSESGSLLDEDGEPNVTNLRNAEALALAHIASAIHKNAASLRADSFELAILWLKGHKFKRYPRRIPGDPFDTQKRLRETPEQNRLMAAAAKAGWKVAWIGILAGVTSVCLLLLLLAPIDSWWALVFVPIFWAEYRAIERAIHESLVTAKEQDRRYIMSCFREANNVSELTQAGWFAYFPGLPERESFDRKIERDIIPKEISRMRDVLYDETEWP